MRTGNVSCGRAKPQDLGHMVFTTCTGQIQTTNQETALDRVISAVNFVDPGLDFFEIFVWLDFPEKEFPGRLPIAPRSDLAGKSQPYCRIGNGQSLFAAKLVEESYATAETRDVEKVYGILIRYTPKANGMAAFPRAPRETSVAMAVARGNSILFYPHSNALFACECLFGPAYCDSVVSTYLESLVPGLREPRWTLDRMPPNGFHVDFPDEDDERLKDAIFSDGVRIWPESPKLIYGCDWANFREIALHMYKEWLYGEFLLLHFFGNSVFGKRTIEPPEAIARHPTLRDWFNNEPYRPPDPAADKAPLGRRPSFPMSETRGQADKSLFLEQLAAGEAARFSTNWTLVVSWKIRREIGRFFGARHHRGDERADAPFMDLNNALDQSGFMKALLADIGNTGSLAACREAIRANRERGYDFPMP